MKNGITVVQSTSDWRSCNRLFNRKRQIPTALVANIGLVKTVSQNLRTVLSKMKVVIKNILIKLKSAHID